MKGRFILASEAETDRPPLGKVAWHSRPSTTGAKNLVVTEATFLPGKFHNFHTHPNQEEVIYVAAGSIEQWLGREKRVLKPGDSVFIPAGEVHATFNPSQVEAKIVAILGPCVGAEGYELVDVSNQPPWNTIR